MASTPRQQPHWKAPRPASDTQTSLPPLTIYNSLTRSKTPFVPQDVQSNKVTWYACGPTVYDDSHLGHARNYVTTDIIRRIMRDYFEFKLTFVMNITDVDDKIILRGRQQHLLEKFKERNTSVASVRQPALDAYRAYAKKNAPKLENVAPESYAMKAEMEYGEVLRGKSLAGDGTLPGDKEAKLKMHLKTLATASEALAPVNEDDMLVADFYAHTEDVLLPYLDSLHGDSIDAEDHTIFTKLTRKYEQRFTDDMRALHCVDPDIITRVTGYVPQIVEYVERIVKHGFGYATSDGSVYFDIEAFKAAGNHYGRLAPENVNDKDLQADGEGALTKKSNEKRSDADFALWKSSKPGEPSWSSPWGKGRPGWHIECSAMASDVLGEVIDIHSGGVDLAFPHHDNELAQSEAYYNPPGDGCSHQEHQWINYFMHMGHLSIQGSKMSKSLKNFTTIREALSRGDWTPRGLRIVFLLGNWKDGIEITDDLVRAGAAWEDKVNNFFLKVQTVEQNQAQAVNGNTNGTSASHCGDEALLRALSDTKSEVHDALSDSFNTTKAMRVISDLITDFNSANKPTITDDTTIAIGTWVTFMVRIFGLDIEPVTTKDKLGWSGIDIPDAAKSFVYPVSKIRDEVRQRAKNGHLEQNALLTLSQELDISSIAHTAEAQPYATILSDFSSAVQSLATNSAPAKDYLQLCDDLRDVKLWAHGIYLEDSLDDGAPALVRPLDRQLIAARAEKEQRDKERLDAKAKREQEAAKRAEKGRLDPREMFKAEGAEFGAWDTDGVPTHDREGVELAKSRVKKCRKLWEAQRKAHEAWKAERSG